MVFHKLGAALRHLGHKAVHVAEHGLHHLKHIGSKVHEAAGKVPVVGAALQGAMSAAYHMPVPGIGRSAKDMVEGAEKAIHTGKMLTHADPDIRKEGYSKLVRGDHGSAVQRVAQATRRITNAIS